MLGNGFTYINIEIDEYKEFAIADPMGFLEKYKGGVILDEVQRVPSLFPYLQICTDRRNRNGEYILSGSQNFLLLEKITQSLAGRVAIFTLLPFSLHELLPYIKDKERKWSQLCLRGFYPRLFKEKKMNASIFYSSYLKTYIEKDIHQILNIQTSRSFKQFIKLCAARAGCIFNAQELAKLVGVDNRTIARWVSVLEASYIIHLLPAHFENYDKRILKKPKLYFYDTGLLCHILSIKSEQDLLNHSLVGHIFENFIINEIVKNRFNKGLESSAYYWQDSNHNEVDLILNSGEKQELFEIKMSKTVKSDFFKNLQMLKKLAMLRVMNQKQI